MPPMTWLGWFHTILGAIAILTAAYTFYQNRIIRASDLLGRVYLLITLFVAGSALAIYNQGGFGVGHWLAVLTLTAMAAGFALETLKPVGKWSIYMQTGAYSATVLFHMIPAITDFLRRLPVGDPFVASLDAPLVRSFHLAFLSAFAVGVLLQWIWLMRARDQVGEMLFIAITLGFVVVVTGCMILINRWMVSQRPPASEEDPGQDDDGLSSQLWGAFSPIHLLSAWTLFSLVMAVHRARRDNIVQHKIWMVLLYVLALLVTGLFTLWPGRVMNQVLLGG